MSVWRDMERLKIILKSLFDLYVQVLCVEEFMCFFVEFGRLCDIEIFWSCVGVNYSFEDDEVGVI